MTPGSYSLGMKIGLPIAVVAVLLLIAAGGFLFAAGMKHGDDRESDNELKVLGSLVVVGALIVATLTGVAFYPFDPTFHRYYNVSGPVESIGNRQISNDNGGMSTRYVFRINGEDFGVDDTRASLTKPGDTVKLKCKKEYVYQSSSGWACNWSK